MLPTASCLLQLIILLVFLPTSRASETAGSRARTAFECTFQRDDDQNADRQPDGWRRLRDRQHPAYIQAEMVPRNPEIARQGRRLQIQLIRAYRALKHGNWEANYVPETIPPSLASLMDGFFFHNCLEVRMDSGAFELIGPRFEVDARLSYRLQAEISSHDLSGHEAVVELHVLNPSGETVHVWPTNRISGTSDWQTVNSETVNLAGLTGPLVGQARIRVMPKLDGSSRGIVQLDNIRVFKLPATMLESNAPYNIARLGETIEVSLRAMGLSAGATTAQFELIDVDENVVQSARVPIEPMGSAAENQNRQVYVSSNAKKENRRTPEHPTKWTSGRAVWNMSVDQPGFYHVRANVDGAVQNEMPLAALLPSVNRGGTFGWTFDRLDDLIENEDAINLIFASGIGWVKLPVWIDATDSKLNERLVRLVEKLKDNKVQCIGVVDRPPEALRHQFNDGRNEFHAVTLIDNKGIWYDSIDPILSELNLRLDWLHFGQSDDLSFANRPTRVDQLSSIRRLIQADGYDFKLAVGWDWHGPTNALPKSAADTSSLWDALHYSTDPQLATDELSDHANAVANSRWQTWTSIPLQTQSDHTRRERVINLLEAMIAVKESNIQAAFIDRVFDDQIGLLASNRQVGELLVPWTNLGSAIATKQSGGTFALHEKSDNRLFTSDQGTVMVVWRDQPAVEHLYLGDHIQANDIWGRSVEVEAKQSASGSLSHRISVGTWPLIVSGIDKHVLEWQQSFELLADHISSHLVDRGSIQFRVHNPFDSVVTGKVVVYAPSLLTEGSVVQPIEISPHDGAQFDVPFAFRPDTSSGKHELEFAFEIESNATVHRFSMNRSIRVGHPELDLRWTLVRIDDQTLEASVEATNNSYSPVSFDCKLFPKDLPYQRIQLSKLAKGVTSKSFRLAISKGTSNQNQPMWVRCEQIGTGLILNYQVSEQSDAPPLASGE